MNSKKTAEQELEEYNKAITELDESMKALQDSVADTWGWFPADLSYDPGPPSPALPAPYPGDEVIERLGKEKYDKMKQELIEQSRFYSAPVTDDKPYEYDPDWD